MCAALLVTVLAAGCTDDSDETSDPDSTSAPSQAPSSETSSDDLSESAAEGPVAGAGAALSPDKPKQWCNAITADQLAAVTGTEVAAVTDWSTGIQACGADLPGVEFQITWGSEPTKQSFTKYAETWNHPADAFAVRDAELPGGKPGLVATQPVPEAGHAGTVIGGRLIEVSVSEVIPDDMKSVDDLGAIAEQILAVYAS
ncbi:hypothetical protein [Nocardioides allogilvus]|nr:hypothetical protein [Nocardioides allogilvus]EON25620.1 prefoldin subunit 2 [Nocardioides sp. CF8]